MKRLRRSNLLALALVVALVGGTACGGDETPSENSGAVEPPENPERALPTRGAPQDDEFEEPPPQEEYVREDRVSEGAGDGECCPVVFAYAPRNPAAVAEMVVRGNVTPLNADEGLWLEESDGVWSGEACLSPEQPGTYYYEVSLEVAESDTYFVSTAYNPYAPTTTEAGEVVNGWFPEGDCASTDIAIHAQTTE